MSAVDRDDVFDLLASHRRRRMLRHLDEYGPTTLREIAEVLTAIEEDEPTEELSESDVRRVYISLYQYHLPKLEKAGVVDVDDEDDVRLTELAEEPLAYLRFSPGEGDGPLSTVSQIVGGESR